jgi:hypothetical protein
MRHRVIRRRSQDVAGCADWRVCHVAVGGAVADGARALAGRLRNKCLAQSNKSPDGGQAIKKRVFDRAATSGGLR